MVEIVSLAAARRQLRMEEDDSSRDVEIGDFIADAAAWVQSYTGHLLEETEVIEQHVGRGPMALDTWPIFDDTALTATIEGADGLPVLISTRLSFRRRPATLLPIAADWPYSAAGKQFTVTFTAGYQAADQVPRNFRRAMLILITAYDDDREGGETFQAAEATARRLCARFRLHTL